MESREIDARFDKTNAVWRELYRGHKTEALKYHRTFNLCSDPRPPKPERKRKCKKRMNENLQ